MKHFIDCLTIERKQKKGIHWSLYRTLRYIFCRILLFFYHPKHLPEKKYTISICAIFKNEGTILKEWIEYHHLIGIDHIYLYNNFSNDNYEQILQPYIENGFITLTDWPIEGGQKSAYLHCYNNFKEETNWIAYIDLDEFICPTKDNDVHDWIKRYKKYPTVYIRWKMFMCSGIIERNPDDLVIETNTQCWPKLANLGKSIINTSYEFERIEVHQSFPTIKVFGIKTTIFPVDEYQLFFTHWKSRNPKGESTIQINHYYYRSYNQYVFKSFINGDAIGPSGVTLRTSPGFFEHREQLATTKDFTIHRFLTRLKVRMKPSETIPIPQRGTGKWY